MEYSKLYLDWVIFLKKNNLYGLWIRDIVVYIESTIDVARRKQEEFYKPYEPLRREGNMFWFTWKDDSLYSNMEDAKSYLLGSKQKINELIRDFSRGSDYVKILVSAIRCTLNSLSHEYKVSSVHWGQIYEQFINRTRPKLSVGLSRKLTRTNNKTVTYKYKEKVEQPWYNKSYEKYNRKAWRK